MPKTLTISQDDFKQGLVKLPDDVNAPFGSARTILNATISDRGGISPRPGTELLGDLNETVSSITGFFNFKKSLGADEWMIKAYKDGSETKMEYYHPTEGWQLLKGGFTADKEFGFTTSLVNIENEDYVYFCNRHEPYQRWSGIVTQLDGALAGAESSITVDSVLKPDILETGEVDSATATTIDVSNTPWVADQWINMYVYMTSGTHDGKIRKITDNDDNTLTFDTLGSAPSNGDTFEIRQAAFPASGTLIYNGTTIAYTAIPEHNKFTVSSAHSAPDNTPVTIVPEEFPGAPRGNRLENNLTRVYVGNVRSAVSRDSSGNQQASTSSGSVFVSKIQDPSDFEFASTRVAGEGDIISTPHGGGHITDIKAQESVVYIYKERYIEALAYSQDSNDIAVREPLKAGAGSIGKVIVGRDDHYFMNSDKQLTSLGRVRAKDILPQTENIGNNIKRLLDVGVYDEFDGIEFENKIYMAFKKDSSSTENDRVLVFNRETSTYEGLWALSVYRFVEYKGNLYYAESKGANVWKMLEGDADVQGDDVFPMSTVWQSNFFNVLPLKANTQSLVSLAVDGFIRANSKIRFRVFRDFFTDPALDFTFGGTEEDFLKGEDFANFFGSSPLGTNAIGSFGEAEEDGRRRFSFMVYFPFIYGQEFSTMVSSEGKNQDWEVTRVTYGLSESISTRVVRTKEV